MTRHRLAAYAPFQLRDYLLYRGTIVVALVALVAWGNVYSLRLGLGPDWAEGLIGRTRALTMYSDLLSVFAFVGTVLGVSGLISRDRQRGYFRLLFAQPVGVLRYYVQAFFVHAIGLLLLATLLTGVWGLIVRAAPIGGAIGYVAVTWLALGGLAFLLSAVSNHDTLLMLGLTLMATVVHGAVTGIQAAGRAVPAYLPVLEYLLPPMHIMRNVRDALTRGTPPAADEMTWLLGFGVLCFAAGLVFLRRREMAA